MENRTQKEQLASALGGLGLEPGEAQLDQLLSFYEMVVEKNKVMNLTAITEYAEFLCKHFIDSLVICRKLELSKITHMIDIGTGAGFPGIPIKILFPEIQVLLLDSLNKRVNFLNEVIGALGLSGIRATHSRAEELAGKPEYREKFELCVSRAVANLATLSEYCLPYVAVGGQFVAYKSGNVEAEIKEAAYAIRTLGGEVSEIESFCLPGTEIERSLLHIKKNKRTPKSFPRSAGMPAKSPLKEIKK